MDACDSFNDNLLNDIPLMHKYSFLLKAVSEKYNFQLLIGSKRNISYSIPFDVEESSTFLIN